jgi:hypothetical protein
MKAIYYDIEVALKFDIHLIESEIFSKLSLFNPVIPDSLILKHLQKKIFMEMFPKYKKLELVYRGSRDTFSKDNFHNRCYNLGPHVILLLSKDYNKIFGGFSNITLTKTNGWKQGNAKSFLFALTDKNVF